MYPDYLSNCLHFGHSLLIFIILAVFCLSETRQIYSFQAFSWGCIGGIGWTNLVISNEMEKAFQHTKTIQLLSGGYPWLLCSQTFLIIPRFNEVERGVYWFHPGCLFVWLSVDRMVSALYLKRYSSDPFHICTSYQATSEGGLRIMFVSNIENYGEYPQNAGVLVVLVFICDFFSPTTLNTCITQLFISFSPALFTLHHLVRCSTSFVSALAD